MGILKNFAALHGVVLSLLNLIYCDDLWPLNSHIM